MSLRSATLTVVCALASCFAPEPSSFDDTGTVGTSTSPDATGTDASSVTTMTGVDSGPDTGDAGCAVDEDCVDVDTCSIDTCDEGTCTHTPNVDDPACTCTTAADCDQLPEDDECRTRTCEGGVCGLDFTADGTALGETQQTAEDCQIVVCDGAGESVSIAEDTDVPDDGLECTTDSCSAGVPENLPIDRGTACAAGECNGLGDCVGCSDPADCGGESTFCAVVTCEAGICGVANIPAETVVPEQTAGDCQRVECDGRGNAASVADDADAPPDDGLDCTSDECASGVVVHPARPTDFACASNGGTFCDGEGTCVECTSHGQCGGGGTCTSPACVDHACTIVVDTGAPCDDGLFCTGVDACNNVGACVGSGNPCPEEDGDSDCSERCDEAANACTGIDDNGSDCGACRRCSGGVCNNMCNALAFCCAGDDICISMGQECP